MVVNGSQRLRSIFFLDITLLDRDTWGVHGPFLSIKENFDVRSIASLPQPLLVRPGLPGLRGLSDHSQMVPHRALRKLKEVGMATPRGHAWCQFELMEGGHRCRSYGGKNNPLDVHHLPQAYLDIPYEKLNQLIVLCRRCHMRWHEAMDRLHDVLGDSCIGQRTPGVGPRHSRQTGRGV